MCIILHRVIRGGSGAPNATDRKIKWGGRSTSGLDYEPSLQAKLLLSWIPLCRPLAMQIVLTERVPLDQQGGANYSVPIGRIGCSRNNHQNHMKRREPI
jgi:hypothetical protein